MSKIGAVAQRYLDGLTRIGFGIAPRLAPGIPEEEVRRQLASAGLRPSDAIVDWFGWRNGVNSPDYPLGRIWLVPLGYPISVGEAVEYFRLGVEPEFFYLLPSGGGNRLVVPIVDGVVQGDAGVFDCDYEFWERPVRRFDSILSMLETFAEAVEAGAIFLHADKDSVWKNYDRFREIARRINPQSDFSDETA
jgi:hypothetical protein